MLSNDVINSHLSYEVQYSSMKGKKQFIVLKNFWFPKAGYFLGEVILRLEPVLVKQESHQRICELKPETHNS